MYGQHMETTEKLRWLCALQPVWWKKNDQGRQYENWHEDEKPKARPQRHLAKRCLHEIFEFIGCRSLRYRGH
jgi:hypothetical protein